MEEKKEVVDAEDIVGTFLKGDRYEDDERYKKSVENIYRKLTRSDETKKEKIKKKNSDIRF